MDAVQGILQSAWQVFTYAWWIWLPIILWPLFRSTWLFWRQSLYKRDLQTKYILLELRIPREIKKNPRAMEQVLIAIHALRNAAMDMREIWWDGEVTVWYAMEIVSLGGEIHFYLRTIKKQKDLIQAAFFSYYPDVEVVEVEDYMDRLPSNMGEVHKSGYNLWGTELLLAKEDAYPIRSYLDFESPDEDKQYDAMSTFLEILGKVKKEETVGIQILIAPAAPDWGAKWKDFVEKMRVREQGKKKVGGGSTHALGMEFPHILPVFPVKKIGEDKKDEYAPLMKSFMRTPGETDVLKAVEENLSRPGFDTLVRFFYLSPKELFGDTFPRRGVIGAFNQYGSLDLNYFTQNFAVGTRIKFWRGPWQIPNFFAKSRIARRQERILSSYRTREVPPETLMGRVILTKTFNIHQSRRFMMNTRSLATLFHPPTFVVLTAPHLRRLESKKTGPPAGLAIYGGEEELEKYK
ncbi:MAG: hypothetical protein ABSC29_04075 [Minisyncoccia bacterium]